MSQLAFFWMPHLETSCMSSPFGALIRAQKQAPTCSCEVDAQSVCLCEGICVNTVYNWICPPFCKKSIAIDGVRVGCFLPALEDKKKKKKSPAKTTSTCAWLSPKLKLCVEQNVARKGVVPKISQLAVQLKNSLLAGKSLRYSIDLLSQKGNWKRMRSTIFTYLNQGDYLSAVYFLYQVSCWCHCVLLKLKGLILLQKFLLYSKVILQSKLIPNLHSIAIAVWKKQVLKCLEKTGT